jgi:hypothetical protein
MSIGDSKFGKFIAIQENLVPSIFQSRIIVVVVDRFGLFGVQATDGVPQRAVPGRTIGAFAFVGGGRLAQEMEG